MCAKVMFLLGVSLHNLAFGMSCSPPNSLDLKIALFHDVVRFWGSLCSNVHVEFDE